MLLKDPVPSEPVAKTLRPYTPVLALTACDAVIDPDGPKVVISPATSNIAAGTPIPELPNLNYLLLPSKNAKFVPPSVNLKS